MSGGTGLLSKAPEAYQDWLVCLDKMKNGSGEEGEEIFLLTRAGSFSGSAITLDALQERIVETVNLLLTKSIKRFSRCIHEDLAFGELFRIELLFKRLKKDVGRTLFFRELSFLPESFRTSLESSVKTQMGAFWEKTVDALREMAIDSSASELGDLLYLVNRIRLF